MFNVKYPKDKGQVAFVTHAEDKGNYGQIRFRTTRTDKRSGKKVTSYFSFWRLVGPAFEGFDKLVAAVENAPTFPNSEKKMGVMIVIKSFSISQEPYESNGETVFAKNPSFVIWDWDFYKKNEENSDGEMDTPPVVEEDSDGGAFDETESEEDNPFDD